jgi:hypothetical protein
MSKKEISIITVEVDNINDAISIFNDIRMLKKKYNISKIDIMDKEHYKNNIN